MKCQACGTDKNNDVLEQYPWPDDDGICDDPIRPLFTLDCDDRMCIVCHGCFHKLSPDMWITRNGWESINPQTSFSELVQRGNKMGGANVNRVMLIGRVTRDVETRAFANGGKVANIGFCVNTKAKNQQTGEWEDKPVWLDCSAFNRGEHGKTADLCEQYLRKGSLAFIDGHLTMDEWTAPGGEKRSKLKIVIDNIQFLDSKPRAEGDEPPRRQPSSRQPESDLPPTNDASGEAIPF